MDYDAIKDRITEVTLLRMTIDKIQKKIECHFDYTDQELLECLDRGLQVINAYYPPTTYEFDNLAEALKPYLMLSAAWWLFATERIMRAENGLDTDNIGQLLDRTQEVLSKIVPDLKQSPDEAA
jgi:hypothetical protein